MNKLCSICKRNLIPLNKRLCDNCSKKAKEQAVSKNESFYKTSKWTKFSLYIRNKYHNLDLYQLKVNNKIVKSKIVHHIIPVNDAPERKFDEKNTIPLSSETHSYIENIYKRGEKEKKAMQELLFSLLEEYYI